MYEIYDMHAEQYDELVIHEDYRNNLTKFVDQEFTDIHSVLELGTGTGRLTKLYAEKVQNIICCERAEHMIDKAKINLAPYLNKIKFFNIDTRNISQLNTKVDCVIEGWALGHTAIDEHHRLSEFLVEFFNNVKTLLNKDGKLIIIETMGTNTEESKIPAKELADLYKELEITYKLKKQIIRTDYKFDNIEDAKRIMGFFFGNDMAKIIKSNIVKEYTGIWMANLNKL